MHASSAQSIIAHRPAVLLLGPTGVGKTPLGEGLERHDWHGFHCHHFDFGRQLRDAAVAPSGTLPWRLNQHELDIVRTCLQTGALLENETFGIARKILLGFVEARLHDHKDYLILNGLPRHVDQARMLPESIEVRLLIVLEIDPATVWERIRHNHGGDRAQRSDDTLNAVGKRLAIYQQRTLPLINYYAQAGVPVADKKVEVTSTVNDLLPWCRQKIDERMQEGKTGEQAEIC